MYIVNIYIYIFYIFIYIYIFFFHCYKNIMKNFLINVLSNIFKERNEKKLKKFYNFIIKNKNSVYLNDDDVLYPLSTISYFLNYLENEVAYFTNSHKYSSKNGEEENKSFELEIADVKNNKSKKKLYFSNLKNFLNSSRKYSNLFFDVYLKYILLEKKGKINIKNYMYLFNSLCLLNYDEQKKNCKHIFEKALVEIITINEHYLNQKSLYKKENASLSTPIDSQKILELLTLINKHNTKLEKYEINFDLLNLFYLHLFNYLFHTNFFVINELIKSINMNNNLFIKNFKRTNIITFNRNKNEKKVINVNYKENKINIKELKLFYNFILMDSYNFLSIIFFLNKYNNYNYFIIKNKNEDISLNNIISIIEMQKMHIFNSLFYNPFSKNQKNIYESIKYKIRKEKNDDNLKTFQINEEKNTFLKRQDKKYNNNNDIFNRLNNKYLYKKVLYSTNLLNSSVNIMIWEVFSNKNMYFFKNKRIVNFLLFQNNIIKIKFLKFICFSLIKDFHILNYFNKNIYNHICIYKLCIFLQKKYNNIEFFQEIYIYNKFFEFILKFYISFLCANNISFLLFVYSKNNLQQQKKEEEEEKEKEKKNRLIKLINDEIIKRINKSSIELSKDENYNSYLNNSNTSCFIINNDDNNYEKNNDNYLINNDIYILSTPNNFNKYKNHLNINKRHLYNICNSYVKLDFCDENFIKIIENFTNENIHKLNNKDITAAVYFFSKINYKNKDILKNIMIHIENKIYNFHFNEIHLIFKSYFKLKFFFKESIINILNHLLIDIYTIYFIDHIRKKENYECEDKEFNKYFDFLEEFTKSINSLNSKKKILFTKKGGKLEIFIDNSTLIIKEKEIHKTFLKYKNYNSKEFVKNILNILYILSKYKIKKNVLYDSLYIFIKEKNNHLLHIFDWNNLILSHCKTNYNATYLDKYISEFYKILKEIKILNYKNISILISLCYQLQNMKIKNKILIFDFLISKIDINTLSSKHYNLLKISFQKINHKKSYLFVKNI
ncbi:conserved Plasmodium protein, unknown function [Plasmodium gallinaceum]|uniref:Uncharacterized protein n=1 Tax=Plasmodium gallinaceum TaxID=5849 RepID=A0A1J1H0S4_PLAGA|nr:conserved Plasmodium protein, unknown function [Plasmodium gallinaceum]CRG96877.1 conserved Plasmodium protein, unknown function [Plasmodium gallinaceum]